MNILRLVLSKSNFTELVDFAVQIESYGFNIVAISHFDSNIICLDCLCLVMPLLIQVVSNAAAIERQGQTLTNKYVLLAELLCKRAHP
jgi:hypothetical protein